MYLIRLGGVCGCVRVCACACQFVREGLCVCMGRLSMLICIYMSVWLHCSFDTQTLSCNVHIR